MTRLPDTKGLNDLMTVTGTALEAALARLRWCSAQVAEKRDALAGLRAFAAPDQTLIPGASWEAYLRWREAKLKQVNGELANALVAEAEARKKAQVAFGKNAAVEDLLARTKAHRRMLARRPS